MPTSKADIEAWIERARADDSRWMLVICDTFEGSDFPVFYPESDLGGCLEHIRKAQEGQSMERLMEVYDLKKPLQPQLDAKRAMEIPNEHTIPPVPVPLPVREVQVRDG